MADVFISYAREDRLAAQRVAGALQRHGWSVWWDADIPPGKTWDELIERELAAASCAVVLWSATSLRKGWVKAEAADALARGVLRAGPDRERHAAPRIPPRSGRTAHGLANR